MPRMTRSEEIKQELEKNQREIEEIKEKMKENDERVRREVQDPGLRRMPVAFTRD